MFSNSGGLLGSTIEEYKLQRILGNGSTSTVFLGQRQEGANEELAAIKVLTFSDPTGSSARATFRMRFLREARAASRLSHEHILPVLSFGEVDGLTYMILPYISGGTLATWLASQRKPAPLAEVADYLDQIASALDYAHQRGLVHRDVKPSNILLDEQRKVHLTDFGIARLYDSGGSALTRVDVQEQGTLTQTGEVLGTPYYMAPEQIRGEPVGPATDVYALGVVLYLLVTGQVPYQGDSPLAVAMQHLQEEPCPPHLLRADLPLAAEAAMLRALAKQPAERFASAGDLAAAFKAGIATPVPELERTSGATRPSSASLAAAVARTPSDPYQRMVGTVFGGYHLDEWRGTTELGPLFAAHLESAETPSRLRILPLPQGHPAETGGAYVGRFLKLAHQVAELEHPCILPLVDYGSFHGMPYLVSPAVNAPSLAAYLHDRGPLDPTTADRWLDQIGAALEHAHAQHILHGNLAGEYILLPGEKDALVADFGVRQMLDLVGKTPQSRIYFDTMETCAPEQLRGEPVDTYSDVYALGVLLYEMLTGHPVFAGATPDDVAQQHLHASPPPLRRWRAGLPAALENILARALAKEPAQRYQHPSELCDAVHHILSQAGGSYAAAAIAAGPAAPRGQSAPARPAKEAVMPAVTPILQQSAELMTPPAVRAKAAAQSGDGAADEAPPATTPSGGPRQGATRPGGASAAAQARRQTKARRPPQGERPASQEKAPAPVITTTAPEPAAPASLAAVPEPAPVAAAAPRSTPTAAASPSASPAARLPRPRVPLLAGASPRRQFAAVAVVLVLIGGSLGIFRLLANHTPPGPPSIGTITFLDSPGNTTGNSDAIRLDNVSLPTPQDGFQYYAWLLSSDSEQTQILGPLKLKNGKYSVLYAGKGTNLLGPKYDEIHITLEQTGKGQILWPRGQTVATASFPPGAFMHIGHLLVAWTEEFPTPNHIGFLVGLVGQMRVLNAQAQALKAAADSKDPVQIQCAAQSVIDVIEGSSGPSYQALDPACANYGITQTGDGYGILGAHGYTAGVSDHAHLADIAPDATSAVHTYAKQVQTAVDNVNTWATNTNHAAWWILHHPDDTSGVSNIVTLCSYAYQGVDTDDDGRVDPVTGEAGALQAYSYGQQMATLSLVAPKQSTH